MHDPHPYFTRLSLESRKCHFFALEHALMFALWKHSQERKPPSYQKSLDGQDSVFYMPKGTQSQQISVIENHLNYRAVPPHREKVTCFKCFFMLFPNFEPKCQLSISPPVVVEKRTNPEDQLEKMRLRKTIKRLNRQVFERSRCIARLTLQHRPLTTEFFAAKRVRKPHQRAPVCFLQFLRK